MGLAFLFSLLLEGPQLLDFYHLQMYRATFQRDHTETIFVIASIPIRVSIGEERW